MSSDKIIIMVRKRWGDFHACIHGQEGHWDCGRTQSEAVGELIRTHPELFPFTVEWFDLDATQKEQG